MLTQELVKDLFDYEDGDLIWRNPLKHKSQMKGKKVTSVCSKGYIRVGIKGCRFAAHRVIFLYHKGYLPTHIDHINTNKKDNRIENLRACDNTTNSYNSKLSKANTSGVKGVSWSADRKMWHVQITSKGVRVVSELFKDISTAKDFAQTERVKFHGDIARDK